MAGSHPWPHMPCVCTHVHMCSVHVCVCVRMWRHVHKLRLIGGTLELASPGCSCRDTVSCVNTSVLTLLSLVLVGYLISETKSKVRRGSGVDMARVRSLRRQLQGDVMKVEQVPEQQQCPTFSRC